jgi:hypothetical protein
MMGQAPSAKPFAQVRGRVEFRSECTDPDGAQTARKFHKQRMSDEQLDDFSRQLRVAGRCLPLWINNDIADEADVYDGLLHLTACLKIDTNFFTNAPRCQSTN